MEWPRKKLYKCSHLKHAHNSHAELMRGSWIQWYDQICMFKRKRKTLEIIRIKDYSEQDLCVIYYFLWVWKLVKPANLSYRIKKIIKVRLNLIETMLAATFSYTKDTKKPPLLSHISPMEGSLTLKFEIF